MTLRPGTRFYLKDYRRNLRDNRIMYQRERYIIRRLHGDYIECEQQLSDNKSRRVFVNRTSAIAAIASGHTWDY